MDQEIYKKRLKTAADLLRLRWTTAGELAEIMNVSRPTAYAFVKALKRKGYRFEQKPRRVGERGPEARGYRLDAAPSV